MHWIFFIGLVITTTITTMKVKNQDSKETQILSLHVGMKGIIVQRF